MDSLNEAQLELLYHILEKIAKCEGGHIDVYYTNNDECIMNLTTDIPVKFWCEDCLKCAICRIKLIRRWTKNLKSGSKK